MAKIAVEFHAISKRADGHATARPARRLLVRGHGWSVSELICSAGPHDRRFEEQFSETCIALVTSGSFQYRSSAGCELMTPGSLLLGNAGQYFECGHEHAAGDRCISFSYEPEYFEDLLADAGVPNSRMRFSTLRVPPVRELSRLAARACAGLAKSCGDALAQRQSSFSAAAEKLTGGFWEHRGSSNAGIREWEEMAIELAGRALEFPGGQARRPSSPSAEARVTRVVRMIESRPDLDHRLGALAREAKLSRYHFLRIFQQLTGLTPHQYVLRTRLRLAAMRLMLEPAKVLDIALDSGFGDVSNFNHAFRAEFGVSPRTCRSTARNTTGGAGRG